MPDTLVDERGEPCGGIHGFASALVAVLGRHGSASGAVAFDESLGSCFRNELYPDYKANRAPPDDNIIYQFGECARLCELLGVQSFASTRFEADDLITTLAFKTSKFVTIYTKDKDLRQLVNSKCKVWDLVGQQGFNLAGFTREYRFAPSLFPDYQALVGDSSDNVPGVPGFGPKTAGRLVQRYGALEPLFESVERWTDDKVGVPSEGKLAQNLADHAEQALAMRELLRLAKDAPLPAGPMRRGKVQTVALQEFLQAKRLRKVTRDLTQLGVLAAS